MRKRSLDTLEKICNQVFKKYGTIRTNGLAMDYHIERQKEICYMFGVTRDAVEKILLKYTNWMIKKALRNLDDVCKLIIKEGKTDIDKIEKNHFIIKNIEYCYLIGCNRGQVEEILSKYQSDGTNNTISKE